jgi:hypothetical protein
MSEVSEIITASAALLATFGGGLGVLWKWASGKFDNLQGQLDECQKRELSAVKRRGVLFQIIEVLHGDLQRVAPKSKALARRDELLTQYKDMQEE